MLDLTDDRAALRRACERLRSLSDTRLTRARSDAAGPAGSIADEVHELCRWAASVQGLSHPVPRLHPLASGDQLAVIGGGILDWAGSDASGRADPVLEEWRSRLRELRTLL